MKDNHENNFESISIADDLDDEPQPNRKHSSLILLLTTLLAIALIIGFFAYSSNSMKEENILKQSSSLDSNENPIITDHPNENKTLKITETNSPIPTDSKYHDEDQHDIESPLTPISTETNSKLELSTNEIPIILGNFSDNTTLNIQENDAILFSTDKNSLYLINSNGIQLIPNLEFGDARGVSSDAKKVYFNSINDKSQFFMVNMENHKIEKFKIMEYKSGFLLDRKNNDKCFYINNSNIIQQSLIKNKRKHFNSVQGTKLESSPDLLYHSRNNSNLKYSFCNIIYQIKDTDVHSNHAMRLYSNVKKGDKFYFNPMNDEGLIFNFSEPEKLKIRKMKEGSSEITINHSFESIERISFSEDGKRLYLIGLKEVVEKEESDYDSAENGNTILPKEYILITINTEKLFDYKDFVMSSSKINFDNLLNEKFIE